MSSAGLERRLAAASRQVGSTRRTPQEVEAFVHDDNIVRFATDRLGLTLFPRQATLLKVITCAEHLLTAFDVEVIEEWTSGYTATDSPDGRYFEGIRGTTPDLIERMRHCRQHGRNVFRETTLVAGRRSSKTFTAAIVTLWQVTELLSLVNPQATLGLPDGKQITFVAMSTNKDSTSRDVFGDLAGLARNAPSFRELIEHSGADSIRFWTPAQIESGAAQRGERGLVVLSALPTTASAGRGPAVYGTLLDEAAHLGGLGSTSTTTEIHRTLAPAMAQFPGSFTVMASSPWTMTGRFYEAYRSACEVDPTTGEGAMLDAFTLQIPSWELYRNWDHADAIEMWPHGPTFSPLTGPVIAADSRELEVERQRDPASYLVEFEGQWATVADRYLPASTVDMIFAPLDGRTFEQLTQPRYGCRYVIHIDLSLSGDNSALVLGHVETINQSEHVVIDHIRTWRPSDYPQGLVDYDEIADCAVELATIYDARISLDQFQSMAMIDKITHRQRNHHTKTPRGATMNPRVVTASSSEKLARWELTKTCAAEGRVHAPFDRLLRDELSFLRRVEHRIEAPTSGPVTTDDAADALSHVVVALLGAGTNIATSFRSLSTVGGATTWDPNPYSEQFTAAHQRSTRTTRSMPERGRHYRR